MNTAAHLNWRVPSGGVRDRTVSAPRVFSHTHELAVPTTSESDYRKLANALPHIIWTCDAKGRLEWVNDRWMDLTGLSEEESLNGKGALVAVHPDDRDQLQQRFGEAVAN